MEVSLDEKFKYIESLRQGKTHDLYIVAGQLQVSNVSPIDSWTFFLWLQSQGIPSVYILKKEDAFYKDISHFKDVIALESFNRGYELLDLTDIWARACAFVVEWDLGGTEIDYWLHDLADCRYVFLQHGVIGTCITDLLVYPCKHIYNDINVFSEKEKSIIEEKTGVKNCFIGGLPRFEFLNEKRNKVGKTSEKTVFIMFTWRYILSQNPEKIIESEYWKGLNRLLSHNVTFSAKEKGIKFVIALHHSLLNNIKTSPGMLNVCFIKQGEISSWIRKADMFITDFSSASFDFLYQSKPVVYWIPDKNDPLYEEGSLDRLKMDSAMELKNHFFNLAETLDDVVNYLQMYLENDFLLEPEKRRKTSLWFDYRKNFSRRIFERIEERLTIERTSTIGLRTRYEKRISKIERELSKSQKRMKLISILISVISFTTIIIILCARFL